MTFGYRERTPQSTDKTAAGSPSATGQTGAAKPPEFVSVAQRAAALRRTQVWRTPPVPISKADLKRNPSLPGKFAEDESVECRIVIKPMGGTTPKFDCERADKEVIRVK